MSVLVCFSVGFFSFVIHIFVLQTKAEQIVTKKIEQIIVRKLDRYYVIPECQLSPRHLSHFFFCQKFENWLDAADKTLVFKTPCSNVLLFVLGACTAPECEIKTSLIFSKNHMISLAQLVFLELLSLPPLFSPHARCQRENKRSNTLLLTLQHTFVLF